jgi:hypothetical protein
LSLPFFLAPKSSRPGVVGQFKRCAEPHCREGAIGRRPSSTASGKTGPGRHCLSRRERILAETLRQRGNRVVTNNLVIGPTLVPKLGLFLTRLKLTPMRVPAALASDPYNHVVMLPPVVAHWRHMLHSLLQIERREKIC